MRKLATIQRITKLEPIDEKDRIELSTILGWKVIVQKGQFREGDLVIFVEPDSILPEKTEFEFLRSRCYSKKWKGFRIRTMKMGEVYSQGIVFHTGLVADIWGKDYVEGQDVTEELQIRKYDPEATIEKSYIQDSRSKFYRFIMKYFYWIMKCFKKKKETFPSHLISKTDEGRIQNFPNILERFRGTKVYYSEKIDGASGSFIYHKKKFWVCSRNVVVHNKNSHYWKIAEKYDIQNKLKRYKNIAIQGEIIGEGVGNGSGKNLYEITGVDFYVFNVIDTNNRRVWPLSAMLEFCQKNEFRFIPILYKDIELNCSLEELINFSKGDSLINSSTPREGIVIRSMDNKYQPISKVGDRLSFKVINPEFLIKYKL